MLDIVILLISTISSFIIEALAWLIDIVCNSCMSAFLPAIGTTNMSIDNWWRMMGVSDTMHDYFPFLRSANQTFMVFSLVIISVLFMFNILKNFQPGIRREGLFSQIYRAVLAVVLVAISYQAIGGAMALGYKAIESMTNEKYLVETYNDRLEEVQNSPELLKERSELKETFKYKEITSTEKMEGVNIGTAYRIITREALIEMIYDNESDLNDTAKMAVVVLVPLVLMVAIAWNAIKLFIEISERLVATTLITSLAPLGFCTVVTEETEGIFRRYLSMVFSTYLVYIIDIWFIRAFMYCSYTYLVQYVYDVHIGKVEYIPTNFTWFFVLQLAWLIVAQKVDQYLRDAGLSVAQTGGKLLGELALAGRTITGSMKAAHRMGQNAHKHFNKLSNNAKTGKHHQGALGGASRVMKNALGSDGWDAMKKAGFVPTKATDYAEAVKKNGKATGDLKGKFTNDKGQAVNFRTCKDAATAANNGHACYYNAESGKFFEVWSDSDSYGARGALAPNNTSMSEFKTDSFDKAESAASNYLNGTDLTKESIGEAGEAYRKELCGGKEDLMAESAAAAESLLPESMRDRLTPIAAGFDANDADDVSHLACIDNSTGRIVNFDMTTGDASHDSLFNDRSTSDSVDGISGFSYTDNGGKTVTAMVQSDVSVDEFRDTMRNSGNVVENARKLSDGSITYRTYDENGHQIHCRWFSSARQTQYSDGRTSQQYINGQSGRVERLTSEGISKNTRRHSQKKVFGKLFDRTNK